MGAKRAIRMGTTFPLGRGANDKSSWDTTPQHAIASPFRGTPPHIADLRANDLRLSTMPIAKKQKRPNHGRDMVRRATGPLLRT
jgi:hypothetical protein